MRTLIHDAHFAHVVYRGEEWFVYIHKDGQVNIGVDLHTVFKDSEIVDPVLADIEAAVRRLKARLKAALEEQWLALNDIYEKGPDNGAVRSFLSIDSESVGG